MRKKKGIKDEEIKIENNGNEKEKKL